MKTWQEVRKEINIHKNINNDCLSAMDNTIYHYIQKMCKTCKFYENKCKKKRNIMECARKGLKNKE